MPQAAASPASRMALAIAGDYMSAVSFPGYFGAGLHFRLRWPDLPRSASWPLADHPFLIAERLRNLGKYTSPTSPLPLKQKQIRTCSACGSLGVVAFYLIAQMVGAGS